jgi:hypothetical protein
MKLLLTAFCAAMITSPLAFAGDKCEKKKCDKEKEEATLIVGKDCDKKKCDKDKDKEEATLLAHCGKCGKECAGEEKCEKCKKRAEEKKEGTLMAGKDCDKKKCDKDKEEATLLAHCGKCGDCKKKDCEKCKKAKEEKKEETLMAESKCKKKCDKEEEEATLA